MRTLIAYITLCAGMLLFACHVKAQEVYPGVPYSFATHQLAEEHYYHAKLSVYQCYQRLGFVEDSLNACLAEEEVPSEPLGCEVFKDWGGGALWKPVRDGGGAPVFLLQASYCEGSSPKISDVKLLQENGFEASTTTFRHCGQANGGRLHWNINKLAKDLPKNLVLSYKVGGVTECRSIPDPEVRYD